MSRGYSSAKAIVPTPRSACRVVVFRSACSPCYHRCLPETVPIRIDSLVPNESRAPHISVTRRERTDVAMPWGLGSSRREGRGVLARLSLCLCVMFFQPRYTVGRIDHEPIMLQITKADAAQLAQPARASKTKQKSRHGKSHVSAAEVQNSKMSDFLCEDNPSPVGSVGRSLPTPACSESQLSVEASYVQCRRLPQASPSRVPGRGLR